MTRRIVTAGDIVRCITHKYNSVNFGDHRKVIAVNCDGNYILRNSKSPRGESTYHWSNFEFVRNRPCYEHPFSVGDVVQNIKDDGKLPLYKELVIVRTYFCGTIPYIKFHGNNKSYGVKRFAIVSGKRKIEMRPKSSVIYIAVLKSGVSYEELSMLIDSEQHDTPEIKSDTSFEKLKAAINRDIQENPDHRWVIFTATTLAETSAPPVSYRSI